MVSLSASIGAINLDWLWRPSTFNMLDRAGGMQIRIWTLAPKFEKKQTIDQTSREAEYRFTMFYS